MILFEDVSKRHDGCCVDLFVEDEEESGLQMREEAEEEEEEEEERDCFCFVWHPLRLILRLGLRLILMQAPFSTVCPSDCTQPLPRRLKHREPPATYNSSGNYASKPQTTSPAALRLTATTATTPTTPSYSTGGREREKRGKK